MLCAGEVLYYVIVLLMGWGWRRVMHTLAACCIMFFCCVMGNCHCVVCRGGAVLCHCVAYGLGLERGGGGCCIMFFCCVMGYCHCVVCRGGAVLCHCAASVLPAFIVCYCVFIQYLY